MNANFLKSLVLPMFAAASVLALVSCEKDPASDDQTGKDDTPPAEEELVLSKTSVCVSEKGTDIVSIVSGNGGYGVQSDNEDVVKATVNESNIIISAVAVGSAGIKVTDAAGKTASVAVKVTPQAKGVNMGVGYGGGNLGTHTIVRVPIVQKYSDVYDFSHMSAVTMECMVMFPSFLKWEDTSTGNWLNSIMGAGDNFWLRLNDNANQDGTTIKVNAVVPGIELNTAVIEAGKWYHVALTFKAGTVKLYLNGELAEEGTSSQDFVDLTLINNLPKKWEDEAQGIYYQYYDFFLGQWNQSRFLNGCMAEARLWSVARSDDQIADNATYLDINDEVGCYGLLGYWKLSGDEGTALKDYSPNRMDAEILGENTFVATDVPVEYSR